jgi:NTP pyrophosphatase (non-canonical NTP hydrolase)
MTFNEYQKIATTTVKDSIKDDLDYFVLGLVGEAGEVAEKLKKFKRDLNDYQGFKEDLICEISDVAWYLSQIARVLDVEFNEVAEVNIAKLLDRKERGVIGGSGDNR